MLTAALTRVLNLALYGLWEIHAKRCIFNEITPRLHIQKHNFRKTQVKKFTLFADTVTLPSHSTACWVALGSVVKSATHPQPSEAFKIKLADKNFMSLYKITPGLSWILWNGCCLVGVSHQDNVKVKFRELEIAILCDLAPPRCPMSDNNLHFEAFSRCF